MPPKSAKKEQKSVWHTCDKCGLKTIQNKLKLHEKDCNSPVDGINNEILNKLCLNHSLPPEIDAKDAPTTYLQRFFFVPETVCTLCNFTMGSYLLIDVNGKKYVRNSWTISDKHLDEVFTSSEGKIEMKVIIDKLYVCFILELHMESEVESSLWKISKFSKGNTAKLTQKLVVQTNEKLLEVNDIERMLKAKLKDTILHKKNLIVVEFLNKRVTFTVKTVTAAENVDIADKFAQIQLDEDNQFYLIDNGTSVSVFSESEDPKAETIKKISLQQIGGLDHTIQDLTRTIDLALGIVDPISTMKISRGVLIHGLSGSGKSMLCQAMAESFKTAHKITIDSWKIFSKFYGESEANLKKHFDEAFLMYPTPTIIIIDEISNICPKNDSSDAVRRVSSLLASLMDSLHVKRNGSKVFVLANTNSLDNVDPAIRRSGRLDYEVEIPVPNAEMRDKIVTKMLVEHQLTSVEIAEIAKHTHGYVGADLENLVSKSVAIAEIDGKFTITLSFTDIIGNLSMVKPSAMRELLIEKPNVKWSDIGGMKDLKLKLKQVVEWPINHPETFERLGIKPPRGLLMFGPPGCSKTMIAKALATESNLNFISIKGSDLFSMWVGESEKAVRDLFVKARQLSPCIIFFDEIDAIGGERSADSGSSVKERVLAQILTEIDGVNVLKNVIIIAATNRPDLIDKALMRPGRLDRIVYVQLPDDQTRAEIFKIKLAKIPIEDDVKIDELVARTAGYSGAEIEAICKEAALKALEDSFDIQQISMKYFEKALDLLKPRTSQELLQLYSDYENRK